MPAEIYLVKVGMNMTEGVVEEWYVPDGGAVTEGELLYRLETEKVNLDVDAERSGTVRHLVAEGITMNPGDVVGYIYAAGEVIPDQLPASGSDQNASAISSAAPTPIQAAGPPDATASTGRNADARIRISPVARRLARDRNLDPASLQGTGPEGRIVEADILAAPGADAAAGAADDAIRQPATRGAAAGDDTAQRSSPMARKLAREMNLSLDQITGTGPGGRITRADVADAAEDSSAMPAPERPSADRVLPLQGMRRTIAKRMQESLQTTAQLTMDMDVRMDDAVKLRSQLIYEWSDRDLRPTYTDLVIRAAAKALVKHPLMNSQLTESELILKQEVHVGVAVALDDGLIVPVVRNADRLSMEDTTRESARLATAARDGTLSVDDLQGGTFTVTALGMFGVDSFTPIINLPQAGILGVNRIRDDTAWEEGQPVRVQMMRLSLTWDHRVLDGAPAARFLTEVRELLEAPYRLLV